MSKKHAKPGVRLLKSPAYCPTEGLGESHSTPAKGYEKEVKDDPSPRNVELPLPALHSP